MTKLPLISFIALSYKLLYNKLTKHEYLGKKECAEFIIRLGWLDPFQVAVPGFKGFL